MNINESFAHLEELEKERLVLMSQLHMWHQVMMQGIKPDDVAVFGWANYLVPQKEKNLWDKEWTKRSCKPEYYNYVRLKDGTKKPLNPFIKRPA